MLNQHRRIDPLLVGDLWKNLAGRRENGAGADVRTYNPMLPGLAYIRKFINAADGGWNFRNLDLFLPTPIQHATNQRQRRRLLRHSQRMEPK